MERAGLRFTIWLAAAALVIAACGSTARTPAPLATKHAPSPTSTAQQLPPAPTNFAATLHQGSVPCPSANADGVSCSQTDLSWQSTADPATWFRVYMAGTGEGPDTCSDVQGDAELALETKPGVTSAQLFAEMSVGGGETCLWIVAVNGVGESTQVPATGQ